MKVKGIVNTTVKKTVTVNGKDYELSCTAHGTMTAPVSYYRSARIRWDADDSYPEEIEVNYEDAEYEVDDTEWDYDENFEFEFPDYDSLNKYLEFVEIDLLDEVYENFNEATVEHEYYVDD